MYCFYINSLFLYKKKFFYILFLYKKKKKFYKIYVLLCTVQHSPTENSLPFGIYTLKFKELWTNMQLYQTQQTCSASMYLSKLGLLWSGRITWMVICCSWDCDAFYASVSMYWTVEYHLISQSEQNHTIGAILTGKWAKKQKRNGEAKQNKGDENAQQLINHWVNFSSLLLRLVSFLQILIYYDRGVEKAALSRGPYTRTGP